MTVTPGCILGVPFDGVAPFGVSRATGMANFNWARYGGAWEAALGATDGPFFLSSGPTLADIGA